MLTNIGIDLGTANTIICSGQKIMLNEPSVVSLETATGKPVKYGKEAYKTIGRSPDRITPVCPIERGVIANYEITEYMLEHFMRTVCGGKMLKPRVMISMPSGITAVQQRSIVDAATNAGARNVCLIEGPVAAAIGIGIDFSKPHGTIIVDVGAGTTDVAVLSMGGLAQCDSLRVASLDFDDAIARYVRKHFNVLIGQKTASEIKTKIGCVVYRSVEVAMVAKGRNLLTGLPQLFEITSNQVCDAMNDVSYSICREVQSVLEKTPPELIADISGDGIYLSGGGALIRGMPELMRRYTGLKVNLVDEPTTCVVKGTGKALKNLDLLKNGDYQFRTLHDLVIE